MDNDLRSLTQSLYAAISGPAGAPRNWAVQDAHFAPAACSYVLHRKPDGLFEAEVLTPEQYRATRQPYFDTNDFYEVEVGHHAEVRGSAAIISATTSHDARPTDQPSTAAPTPSCSSGWAANGGSPAFPGRPDPSRPNSGGGARSPGLKARGVRLESGPGLTPSGGDGNCECGQHAGSRFGDGNRVLEVRRTRTVLRHDRPLVLQRPRRRLPDVHHRLDSDRQARE
jgi:hypothetical protein